MDFAAFGALGAFGHDEIDTTGGEMFLEMGIIMSICTMTVYQQLLSACLLPVHISGTPCR